jgi:Ca-activated chloride channel family protein
VTVTAKRNEGLSAPTVAVTDAEGRARIPGLPPGDYRVKAELEGFDATVIDTVEVAQASRTKVDAKLDAASEEVVTVTAESPLLDERRITTGATVSPRDVARLPGSREPKPALQTAAPAPASAAERDRQAKARADRDEVGAAAGGIAATEPASPVPPPSTGGNAEPNDQPYGDVFFKSYGTNPFVDTEDDGLSTFALDVDTGSYSIVRRYLDGGHLPPAEAVRVEEMVNAFDYRDAAPKKGDFALTAEAAPDPWAPGDRYVLARFAVKAREVARSARRAADLVFVVDVSGSMAAENRLELVKASLRLLLGELVAGDRIGLVVYGSDARVVLPLTGDRAAVGAAIDRLYPEGSTNAEAGLRAAYSLMAREGRRDAIRRLILCSDGVANVGNTGPESILASVATAAEGGTELTTVGFGMGNYNDVLMEQLADRGDGRYAYVDDLSEARRIFVETLTGTLQTVAAEARAQLELDPRYVSRWRLLGYENRDVADDRFRDDTLDAGEVGAGHAVTVLYELKLRADAPANAPLALLRVRWRPEGSTVFQESRQALRRDAVAPRWESASRAFRLATVVARFAEVLRGSYWARPSAKAGDDLVELERRAAEVSEAWSADARVDELVRLVGRARDLRRAGAAGRP